MTARVVAIVNQKGGAGKTTLAMQLAGTVAKRALKTLVVDADARGTATRWASSAPDALPFPAPVVGLSAAGGKVHREVAKFADDYRLIVGDCPPAVDSPVPQSALLIADLALVPIIPPPPDLWTALGIRHLIESMAAINHALQARLVINDLEPRTSLAREVLEILPEFGLARTRAVLHHRTAYRQSAAFGGTVHSPGSRAAPAVAEVEALASEVLKLLEV